MLNLAQLAVLAAIARHGSVTAAAKELHYTQPALSHHLARLEAATGAKLVQRVGRGFGSLPKGNCWPLARRRSSGGWTPPRSSWRRRWVCGRGGCGWRVSSPC
ncbi:hypothetical protein GCM10029964_022100 [Kibdelosporangium lantanae]